MSAPTVTAPPAPRLLSLDALRGFDMLWIIGADALGGALANFHGGAPAHFLAGQLDHVSWAGFHFYDLIFPLFVFMVGAAIPLSLDKLVATDGRARRSTGFCGARCCSTRWGFSTTGASPRRSRSCGCWACCSAWRFVMAA